VTALDTNVLVRVIVGDEPAQAARAAAFLERQDRVFVPKTVLLELEWVLRSAYQFSRPEILGAFRRLLNLRNAEFEDQSHVAQAFGWYQDGIDFADALHVASSDADQFATFDRRLGRQLRAKRIVRLARM